MLHEQTQMHNLSNSMRKSNFSSFLSLLPSTHHSFSLFLSTSTLIDPTRSNVALDSTDVVSSNKRIAHYIRLGDLDSAIRVFNSMKVKTIVSWNSMLSGFGQTPGKFKEARQLFDEIPDPDCFSYNIMLGCYKKYFGANVARAYFDRMPIKDVVSWNTVLSGYVDNGEVGKAWELFSVMPEKNGVSWSAMISGYVKCGDIESAMRLFEAVPVKTVVTWTAMINGYMKAGMVERAEKLFEEMPEKNVVTWNAVIAGYVENCRAEDGLKVFKRMLEVGIRPNSSTLCGALLCSRDLSGLQLGRQIHQLSSKHPLIGDTTVGTSLISMYCKSGNLEDAWKLFCEMPRSDIVVYNAMISGCAQHGAWKVALELFDEMMGEGMKPDWITFIGVFLAFNHAGMVDQAVKYFDSMKKEYGVEKKLDHYTCMVDLLGRAGKLDEAVDLIDKMPLKPNVAIFSTLLGACRVHKNVELAEFAAKSLLDLDPASETAYVQLANVYAAMKRWDQVARVRKAMQANKVVKTPGYSWLEIKGEIHQFRSGDRTHPELTLIHAKLNELDEKMKLAGYVPDLEYALYDVGEEQKQQLLLWHSEKLAIALGLLKLPRGVPIRVFKNLRVCGDCHSAIKYISANEGVEIIVRDTTRFHRFKHGICSCGDYW